LAVPIRAQGGPSSLYQQGLIHALAFSSLFKHGVRSTASVVITTAPEK